jgi:hypothetical protein
MLKNDWIHHGSVLEMQALITTLIENFEFSPPEDKRAHISRKPGTMMIPMAEGETGAWLGLYVKALN